MIIFVIELYLLITLLLTSTHGEEKSILDNATVAADTGIKTYSYG